MAAGSLLVSVMEVINVDEAGVFPLVVAEEANPISSIVAPGELVRFSKLCEGAAIQAVGILAPAVQSPTGFHLEVGALYLRSGGEVAAVLVLDRADRPALEDAKRGDVFGEVAQTGSLSVGHAAKIELHHHFIGCGPK